ncbi:hypothetical protein QAD02_014710 [Eretmocerus hayati]|uniref:Uncharacterized protein n=1 Tax=Eretmocerus hayati TaxID=131215 RepID=A0ACC2P617_9HYME|nr:hypothetical protein QAD02_014710 [Eretmocerus hayati]
MSDDSDYDEADEETDDDVYKRKYQLLAERCEVLQQDNERLVYRIQQAKKVLKQVKKEKKYLINRLDQHGDAWKEAPMGVHEENSIFVNTTKQEKSSKSNASSFIKEEKPKKGTKRKGTKTDPNAPKRPANPFFQFCQEQRRVMERLSGEPEPSKQELTRQLATTWKSLSSEDKKVYYDMYEKSKEKYVAEMQIYNKKADDALPQMSSSTS